MILKPRIVQQLHGSRAGRFQNGALALAPRTLVFKFATVTGMEGRSFSKWGSRLGAADIRLKRLHRLHGWRAGGVQVGALALAPRTFDLKACNSYTDGGRVVFKMGLSPWRRGHSSSKFATVTRMEGGWFSNGALALAPRTFVLKVCNSYTDGGRVVFKMGLSPWRRGHSS